MTVLFNFYKDEIARDVLLRVNKLQKGELTFEDISVNPVDCILEPGFFSLLIRSDPHETQVILF